MIRTLFAAAEPPRRSGRLDRSVFRALWNGLLRVAPSGVAGPVYTPPATGPVHRWYLNRPTDVDLDAGLGVWCPLCDHVLDLTTTGWRCTAPSCWAGWDFQGRRGRWIGGDTR